MALRVWLPLNGTLENKGISDLVFSNTNTTNITIDNNGKIGKCYSRATKGNDGRIISDKNINLNNDISMCCWAYVSNCVGDTANGLVSAHSHADNTGIGITVKQISMSDYRMSCNTGYGSGRTYNAYYGTTNIKNAWHHLSLTYSKSKAQLLLYVDGNLEYTLNNYNNSSKDDKIVIFDWSTTYDSPNYRPASKLNDVRIYDHCLSQKEVKEISKGLVLHYKLDGLSQGSGNNLVTGLTKGGQTTVVGDTIVTSGQNSDTYFKIVLSSALELNKSYTMGIDAENLPDDGYFRFPIGAQNNSSAGYINIYNGHNESVFIANDVIVDCGTSLMMDDNVRTAWPNQCVFKNFYIYENTSITDSSGYGYNGTITGTLTTQQNSYRYDVSTHFNGSSYITVSNPWKNGSIVTEFTHTAWIKWDSNCSTSAGIHSIAGSNNFFRFSLGKSNKLWAYGLRSSLNGETTSAAGLGQYGSATSLVNGQWYFIAVTFKNGVCKCYCDGELVGTVDNSATYPALKSTIDNLYIGSHNGGGEYAIGNVADSRMYCTALSDEDILDLYHTSANIDNENRLHTFELEETSENILSSSAFEQGGIVDANGTETEITTRLRTFYVPVMPNTSYKIFTSDNFQVRGVHFFTENKTWISWISFFAQTGQFTTPSNCYYIRIPFQKADSGANITLSDLDLMVPTLTAIIERTNYLSNKAYNVNIFKNGITRANNFSISPKSSIDKSGIIEAADFIEK